MRLDGEKNRSDQSYQSDRSYQSYQSDRRAQSRLDGDLDNN